MTDASLVLAQNDFRIPPPKGAPAAPPAAASPPPPASSTAIAFPPSLSGELFALPRPVSTGEVIVAGGLFLALLVPFFFVKLSVTRGLQTRYAPPGPASEAGWLLFAWLAFTALVVIATTLGGLWLRYVVIGPAGAVSLLLLILFIRKRGLALSTRR
ncbi:hypothetical protein [Ancylobacter pratisalsi]|uniref:Uncharacterized protein n=1 Tax=Ancylobacter pratisalsi TaxID=1745854 RepID=A0A6P1YND2_9HYPH|nr:hypothetical protein [Ancylobacter pratisalsi]QIB33723.1 hypothetical protein G3A50_08415 [Ancylobacter pratisalsi]